MSLQSKSWHERDARKFIKARQLLSPCVDEAGGVWADFGCGEGIFTAVLYEQIGPSSQIYAVDKNRRALNTLKHNFQETYPKANIQLLNANFTDPLSLPALDGFVLANALHFVKNDQKAFILRRLSTYLRSEGLAIIVEYNTDSGNLAVPFPFNQEQFLELANQAGLQWPRIIVKVPSSFMGEMYAGTALAPQDALPL
jgi:ubiquinone/menaquinone biosynthesis C-methylase UbiE